jgi:hypothetical protein
VLCQKKNVSSILVFLLQGLRLPLFEVLVQALPVRVTMTQTTNSKLNSKLNWKNWMMNRKNLCLKTLQGWRANRHLLFPDLYWRSFCRTLSSGS